MLFVIMVIGRGMKVFPHLCLFWDIASSAACMHVSVVFVAVWVVRLILTLHTFLFCRNVIYWRAYKCIHSLAEVVNCMLGGDGDEIGDLGF